MTQMQLAVAMGKSMPAVSQWERDVYMPRRSVAFQLDEVLDAGGSIIEACGYVTQPDEDGSALQMLAEQVRLLGAEIATLRSELADAGLLPAHASPTPARSTRSPKVSS